MRERIVARPLGILVAAALAATLLSGCAVGSSQAGCAAPLPTIEASPQRAAPGEPITLRGEGFVGRFVCDDTGPGVLEDDTRAHGARDIRLEYRQNGKTWKLDTTDAGRKLGFETRVEVPADARPGSATLRAVGGGTAKTTLRVIEAPDPAASATDTSGSEPPPATLSFGERTERGEIGSYCSTDECVDISGFPVPAEKKKLAAPTGSGVRLDLGDLRTSPVKAGAAALDGKDAKLLAADGSLELVPGGDRTRPKMQDLETRRALDQDLIDLDLPPGEYAIEVFAQVPRGDVSYYFRMKVEPEATWRETTWGSGRGVCGFGL